MLLLLIKNNFYNNIYLYLLDIDECLVSSPCDRGICNNTKFSYNCFCDKGFTGKNCHIGYII